MLFIGVFMASTVGPNYHRLTDYFGKIDAEACAAARGLLQRHSLTDALDEIRAMAASGR